MGTIVKVTKTSNFGRCSGGNRAQRSFDGTSAKNEPQIKADERRFIVWTNRR